MPGCRPSHGHKFSDGLVESVVGAIPVVRWQVLVLLLVLGVSHFMVDGVQVLEVVVSGAHLDAEILLVVEVPGGGMTHHVTAVLGFPYHGALPEGVRDAEQAH